MGREAQNTDVEDRTVADVERIRDIIFGSQIRQYEQRFSGITNQLDLLSRQLEELGTALDQQRDAQESCARELQEDTCQRQTELHHTLSDQAVARTRSTWNRHAPKLRSGNDGQLAHRSEICCFLRLQAARRGARRPL